MQRCSDALMQRFADAAMQRCSDAIHAAMHLDQRCSDLRFCDALSAMHLDRDGDALITFHNGSSMNADAAMRDAAILHAMQRCDARCGDTLTSSDAAQRCWRRSVQRYSDAASGDAVMSADAAQMPQVITLCNAAITLAHSDAMRR
jgi:hypothetical protein